MFVAWNITLISSIESSRTKSFARNNRTLKKARWLHYERVCIHIYVYTEVAPCVEGRETGRKSSGERTTSG